MIIETATLQSSICMHGEWGDNLQTGFMKLDPWSNACGRKGRVPVIIEMATLHTGTCKSRVITYCLDSSSWIHGAMHAKERAEYSSDTDGYTPCRDMSKIDGSQDLPLSYNYVNS